MSIHTRILKILWCRNICSTTLIKIIVSRLVLCVCPLFASKKAKFLRILCIKINRQMFFVCLVRFVPFLIISSVYLHLRVCIHSETYIFIIIITLIIIIILIKPKSWSYIYRQNAHDDVKRDRHRRYKSK